MIIFVGRMSKHDVYSSSTAMFLVVRNDSYKTHPLYRINLAENIEPISCYDMYGY